MHCISTNNVLRAHLCSINLLPACRQAWRATCYVLRKKTMPFKPLTRKTAKKDRGHDPKKDVTKDDLITLEEERLYREGTVAIKDLIAPSAFRVESNFIQLGDVFLRTMYVIT